VRRLEEAGVIAGYVVLVAPERCGASRSTPTAVPL
jgi:DNA-binding Lrp family transcriptional regulator